ncbi:biotin-dependent carboxyltransferase family protein [Roseibium algae]|uniref:Biotin-dependent carboxyltransferase family protein n=1 Tax=Roseibium algae TaxID=3123038 RepID=A0ABU8TJC0_9HYPH
MIEILSIPPLATVQDLGRDNHWFQGLGRAGAMDPVALKLANMMLGNEAGAATLEIPLSPASFRFSEDQVFALTGAACGARLDDVPLPRYWAGLAKAGQELHIGPFQQGGRVYLAVYGGVDVPEILGSRSTQLRESFGGFEGRILRAGDILKPALTPPADFPSNGVSISLPELSQPRGETIELRALPAAEHDSFTDIALTAFWSETYRITPQSNRQGYRLHGPELTRDHVGELRSHGIIPGIVQVPGGGQPIIQLADSATMGGYPKIAAVISADLWRLGQALPGDSLRFVQTDLDGARSAERDMQELFSTLANDCKAMKRLQQGWR